jgi:nicotinamidase-related amidase
LKKIEGLVLAGISTGGVVLSTALEALDMDYKVTILEDCVADEKELHEALIKLFRKKATVLTAEQYITELAK